MPDRQSVCFIIGGARSGKSAHAEKLITALPAPWTYIATAQAYDEEMRERIAHHRARRGEGWETLDAPLDLVGALTSLTSGRPVLVDCLTLWLSNLLHAERDWSQEVTRLAEALSRQRSPVILVTNEVGLGIVPDNALARTFRDAAGLMNQTIAAAADEVEFVVAGLPMKLK